MPKWYAVKIGHQPGVYTDWPSCQKQVKGFPKALYKSFSTKEEAEAFCEPDQDIHEDEYEAILYADGSNYKEGPGGYGYVTLIRENSGQNKVKKYSGQIPVPCTNNIAELRAVLQGLYKLRNYSSVLVRTDSNYVVTTFRDWIKINTIGPSTPNADLIHEIMGLMEGRKVTFEHVYGHKGDEYNELCDQLANLGRQGQSKNKI